jgi:hypothetical protein
MSLKRISAEGEAPIAKKSKMSRPAAPSGAAPDIDEDLHSRQLAVYGRESMRRMAASNILIVGLAGLGVEIGAAPSRGAPCQGTQHVAAALTTGRVLTQPRMWSWPA